MGASQYRHKISFLKPTEAGDGMGGSGAVTWVVQGKPVRAGIWPVKATDVIANNRDEGIITHRIRVRYMSGIRSDMRVQFGERLFEIVGPPLDFEERNRELEIMATEVEPKEIAQ